MRRDKPFHTPTNTDHQTFKFMGLSTVQFLICLSPMLLAMLLGVTFLTVAQGLVASGLIWLAFQEPKNVVGAIASRFYHTTLAWLSSKSNSDKETK